MRADRERAGDGYKESAFLWLSLIPFVPTKN